MAEQRKYSGDAFRGSVKDTNENKGQYTTQFAEGGIIKNLRFPASGAEMQPHFMVFYVNEVLGGVHAESIKRRMSGDATRQAASGATLQAKSSNINANINEAQKLAQQKSDAASGVVDSATAGAASYVADALAAVANTVTSQYVRTNTVLVLPPPENLSVNYSAEWGEESMGEGMLGTAMAVADTIQAGGGVGDVAGMLTKKAGYAAMDGLLGGGVSGALTKNANNPRKELLFKGNVSLRTFEYTWKLNPKSAADSKAIWDIIQMFKYHHLPELNTGGLFLQFPNLFDIEFFSYGKRNDWVPVTLSCALSNISVNYFSSGAPSFFEQALNADGSQTLAGNAPTAIELSMTFMETEPLTRNLIDPNNDFTFNLNTKSTLQTSAASGNGEQGGMQNMTQGSASKYKTTNGGIY